MQLITIQCWWSVQVSCACSTTLATMGGGWIILWSVLYCTLLNRIIINSNLLYSPVMYWTVQSNTIQKFYCTTWNLSVLCDLAKKPRDGDIKWWGDTKRHALQQPRLSYHHCSFLYSLHSKTTLKSFEIIIQKKIRHIGWGYRDYKNKHCVKKNLCDRLKWQIITS